jgi:hypothetical protein
MRLISRKLVLTAAAVCGFALAMVGQESQSLGDVARQSRQQKQDKEAQSKAGGPTTKSKVITNEEIGHQTEPATEAPGTGKEQGSANSHPSSGGPKMPAEQWKSVIQAQKQAINTQQSNIDKLNDSIQFAPANCVSGCVQWNEKSSECVLS